KPAIDACMDPICVVDAGNRIVYFNLPMRSLLGVRPRQVQDKKICFCDIVKLAVCKPSCQIMEVLESGGSARFDETPATRGEDKFRLTLKATAFNQPGTGKKGPIMGAIISVRDVTGDFLVQAKYHKALQLLEQRDTRIAELEEKADTLRLALRRARENSFG
ncbi:MAG TPA: PAS domain-containing protein, partial [Bdellovibrionota bacterium]|nr:PAS domain-containing protein [Bdellovibrionota bacterium]